MIKSFRDARIRVAIRANLSDIIAQPTTFKLIQTVITRGHRITMWCKR